MNRCVFMGENGDRHTMASPQVRVPPVEIVIAPYPDREGNLWIMTGNPPLQLSTVFCNGAHHEPLLRQAHEICRGRGGWVFLLDHRRIPAEVYEWRFPNDEESEHISERMKFRHDPAEFQKAF